MKWAFVLLMVSSADPAERQAVSVTTFETLRECNAMLEHYSRNEETLTPAGQTLDMWCVPQPPAGGTGS